MKPSRRSSSRAVIAAGGYRRRPRLGRAHVVDHLGHARGYRSRRSRRSRIPEQTEAPQLTATARRPPRSGAARPGAGRRLSRDAVAVRRRRDRGAVAGRGARPARAGWRRDPDGVPCPRHRAAARHRRLRGARRARAVRLCAAGAVLRADAARPRRRARPAAAARRWPMPASRWSTPPARCCGNCRPTTTSRAAPSPKSPSAPAGAGARRCSPRCRRPKPSDAPAPTDQVRG